MAPSLSSVISAGASLAKASSPPQPASRAVQHSAASSRCARLLCFMCFSALSAKCGSPLHGFPPVRYSICGKTAVYLAYGQKNAAGGCRRRVLFFEEEFLDSFLVRGEGAVVLAVGLQLDGLG